MQENTNLESNKASFQDKISFYILLGVSFFVPIFFVPAKFISAQYGTSLFFSYGVLLVLIINIILGLKNGGLFIPTPLKKIGWLMFAVPTVCLFSGLWNGISRVSLLGYTFDSNTIGFVFVGFVYLFLVSVYFRDKRRIFYSYIIFVISTLILALFVVLRIIFGASFLSFGIFNQITQTTVGNWNSLGVIFGAGVLLSLFTFEMVHLNKIMKSLVFFALLLSIFLLTLVNFNTIWVVLAISVFVFMMFRLFNDSFIATQYSLRERIKKISPLSLAVFVFFVAFVVWGDTFGALVSNKFNISNVEVRPSLGVTMGIVKNTIKTDPLFGSGPNTFTNQWLAWRPDDVIQTVFWNTDFTSGIGLIPTYFVTTGLLGILSWLCFGFCLFYFAAKSVFEKVEDDFIKYLTVSSFFTCIYLWVMTFFYTPSTAVYVLNFFFTGLFLSSLSLIGQNRVEYKNFVTSQKSGFLFSLLLVMVFVSSVFLGYELYISSVSQWYFQKSSYALNSEDNPDLSLKYMQNAIELVPNDVYYRALSEIELAKMAKIVAQDPKKVSQSDIQRQFSDHLSSAIKAALASEKIDSANYMNYLAAGRIYEAVSSPDLKIQGASASAENHYLEALKRNPKNPSIYYSLARLFVTVGDLKKARDYALEAVKIKKNYLDVYFLISQIEVADKNLNGAIQSVTTASVIDPTNPATYFQLGLLKYNAQDFVGAIVSFEKAISMAPDYANAKYFLGLSYELTLQHTKAISEFQDLQKTNPDSQDVKNILTNLKEGRPLFNNTPNSNPEKSKELPIKEKGQ